MTYFILKRFLTFNKSTKCCIFTTLFNLFCKFSKNIDFMYIRKLKNINFLALISLLLNTCHGINTSTWIYARKGK